MQSSQLSWEMSCQEWWKHLRLVVVVVSVRVFRIEKLERLIENLRGEHTEREASRSHWNALWRSKMGFQASP